MIMMMITMMMMEFLMGLGLSLSLGQINTYLYKYVRRLYRSLDYAAVIKPSTPRLQQKSKL